MDNYGVNLKYGSWVSFFPTVTNERCNLNSLCKEFLPVEFVCNRWDTS